MEKIKVKVTKKGEATFENCREIKMKFLMGVCYIIFQWIWDRGQVVRLLLEGNAKRWESSFFSIKICFGCEYRRVAWNWLGKILESS